MMSEVIRRILHEYCCWKKYSHTPWEKAENGVVYNSEGKKVIDYDFDRDSDAFWITTGKQKSFEEKKDMIDWLKNNPDKY